MHIAFVAQPFDGVLPPDQNSIGLWSYHVARRLATEHRVDVYLKKQWRQSDAPVAEPFTCRFIRTLPQRLRPVFDRFGALFDRSDHPEFARLYHHLEYSLQVALDIRRRKPDVVHVHNFSQFVPVIRAFNPQVKIVLHMQGEWLSQLDYSLIERRLRQLDCVVGSSDHISNLVRQRFPQLADRFVTVYNGFDPAIFGGEAPAKSDGRKHLLFVGRVSPEKGVHVLLEAFQQVADRVPDVVLDIVGPGGEMPREYIVGISDDPHVRALARFYDGRGYEAHLRELIPAALADRVIFHGGLPQSDTTRFYRNAAILVNPSLSESFGMSVIEAGFCSVPSVVARTGGMKETVIDGATGLIAEPSDVDGLASALITLLEDDSRRRAMGQAAQERVRERFSWDRIAADALTTYQRLDKSYGTRKLHAPSNSPGI